MTRQESFKERVRERMAKTGERYTAARQALIARSTSGNDWVSRPEHPDESVIEATGRGWEEWRRTIDSWEGNGEGHAAIARYLQDEHGLGSWWAQSITVGYERISGRRLPHQQSDGTFAASKSRTVNVNADLLRKLILSEDDRAELFGGLYTELRSRPETKTLRVGMPEGVALIGIEAADQSRTRVSVQHGRLDSPEAVEIWKAYWADWLAALDS